MTYRDSRRPAWILWLAELLSGVLWWIVLLSAILLMIGSASAQAQDQTNQNQPTQETNQDQSKQDQPQQPSQPPSQQQKSSQPPQQPQQENPPQNPPPENPPPEKPPQTQSPSNNKKDDSPNAAQQAAQATKKVAIQAAEVTKKLGEVTFVKARDWESGWLTGPYVGRGRQLVTMTSVQRRDIYLQQTFLAPSDYFKRMFTAGIDQARGTPSQWGGGWGGYGQRFASREGQFIAANSLAAGGNAMLGYEPRYDQCRCSGLAPRTRHAILRNFLTYNRSERELRPQWALYGGAFSGGVISTAWKPHPRNALVNGGFAILGQAGYGALLNFFTEFAGDINRKLGARK
jgi:hypothetical protein